MYRYELSNTNHFQYLNRINVFCLGAFGLKKFFPYHIFTRDITNLECFGLCLKKFVTNSKEAEALLKYFADWCKRGKYGVIIWQSKLLRFIPESQIRSTIENKAKNLNKRHMKKQHVLQDQSSTDSSNSEDDNTSLSDQDTYDEDDGEEREEEEEGTKKSVRKKQGSSPIKEDEEAEEDYRISELLNSIQPAEKAQLLFNVIFKGMGISLDPPDFSFAGRLNSDNSIQRIGAIAYIHILLSPHIIPSLKYCLFHKYVLTRLELPTPLILNRYLLKEYHEKEMIPSSNEIVSNENPSTHQDHSKSENKIIIIHQPADTEQFIWGEQVESTSTKQNRKKKKKE